MDKLELAKFVIAFIYNKETDIMTSIQRDGFIECNYIDDDNALIDNQVLFTEGERVIWGVLKGRWRNHSRDSKVFCRQEKDTVLVWEELNGKIIGSQKFKVI